MRPGPWGNTLQEQMLSCVTILPGLFRQIQNEHDNEDMDSQFQQAQMHYDNLKLVIEKYRLLVEEHRTSVTKGDTMLTALPRKALLQRMYGLSMFFAITLNLLLRNASTPDINLRSDGDYFATEIMAIAEEALPYRPFGASYVGLCLVAAYLVTDDQTKRRQMMDSYEIYTCDFPFDYGQIQLSAIRCLGRFLRLSKPVTSK